jgi:hypothetical protein
LATVYTVYSSASDGGLEAESEVSYADAQAKTESTENGYDVTSAYASVYQQFFNFTAEFEPDLWYIKRVFFYFDTSTLPDGTITSAKLRLWCNEKDPSDAFDVVVQNGQPTYPHDPLVVGDLDKTHYSGDCGSLGSADWTQGAYNEISLNADGIAWINRSGTTKFILRSSRDIAATSPADPGEGNTTSERIQLATSEAVVGHRPYLEVTMDVSTTSGDNYMTSTYETLRQDFGKQTDSMKQVTTTGAGSTTTLVSTGLQAWDGANDDYFNKQWIALTGGTYDGSSRFITDYATSTGTATFTPALAGAPGNGVTADIYTYEPTKILSAFQQAVDLCYPAYGRKGLYKSVIATDIITGSWLWNSHFEDWTATTIPDHHVLTGTATVSEETTIIFGPRGSSAMKMTGGGATDYVYQSQVEVPALMGLAGQDITFHCHVYCATASKGAIAVYTKGSSTAAATTTSTYNTGSTEYEHLEVDVDIPDDLTDIKFEYLSGGDTTYFDMAWIEKATEPYKYHLTKDIVHKPIQVFYQANAGTANDQDGCAVPEGGENWQPIPRGIWDVENDGTNYLLILNTTAHTPIQQRKLKVHSIERLTSPTTDATTVEVEGEQARALVAVAAHQLFLAMATSSSASDDQVQSYQARVAYWQAEADRRLQLYGMPMPYNRLVVIQ